MLKKEESERKMFRDMNKYFVTYKIMSRLTKDSKHKNCATF